MKQAAAMFGGAGGLENLMGGGMGDGGDDLKERVRRQMAGLMNEQGQGDGEEF